MSSSPGQRPASWAFPGRPSGHVSIAYWRTGEGAGAGVSSEVELGGGVNELGREGRDTGLGFGQRPAGCGLFRPEFDISTMIIGVTGELWARVL